MSATTNSPGSNPSSNNNNNDSSSNSSNESVVLITCLVINCFAIFIFVAGIVGFELN